MAVRKHLDAGILMHRARSERPQQPQRIGPLRQAEQLLSQTRLSIAEIAERTGFGTPEYFSAAFRKLTGTSPRSARNVRR